MHIRKDVGQSDRRGFTVRNAFINLPEDRLLAQFFVLDLLAAHTAVERCQCYIVKMS